MVNEPEITLEEREVLALENIAENLAALTGAVLQYLEEEEEEE